MKTRHKSILAILIVFALCTCIDPYNPDLKGNISYLVVEGGITNENISYEIKLSRTMKAQNTIPQMVSDASMFISDESGGKSLLKNFGNGSYKTDSSQFTGVIGKTYTLHIITGDGKEYNSDPCTMTSVPEIDSVYYEKGQEYANNQSEIHEGINIYIDSRKGDEITSYYRWDYEEVWKFRLPNIRKYVYVNEFTILPVDQAAVFCWKQRKSTSILFQSYNPQDADLIKKVPIAVIGSDLSDRLTIQYSILVKQYSISEKEYRFWSNLKKVNESTGDIFESQPFSVVSNITNMNDKNEQVLGYFEVSAVSKKRRDITFRELLPLNLPLYHYDCVRIETAPEDYACQFCPIPTYDELYTMWTNAGFVFIEPDYYPGFLKLHHLIFSTGVCSDCSLTGSTLKPAFWTDLKGQAF